MRNLILLFLVTFIIGIVTSYADIFVVRKKDGSILITNIATPEIYKNIKTIKIIRKKRKIKHNSNQKIEYLLRKASKIYNVDYYLLKSIAKVESNYNHNSISSKGAIGIMQLMPETAKRFGVQNPYNLKENIFGGAKYLRYLLDIFHNNYILAIAAYNAGENIVKKYKNIPPFQETRNYVKKVLTLFKKYKFNEEIL